MADPSDNFNCGRISRNLVICDNISIIFKDLHKITYDKCGFLPLQNRFVLSPFGIIPA